MNEDNIKTSMPQLQFEFKTEKKFKPLYIT